MLRITYIVAAITLIGSIHGATAQQNWLDFISAAENAVADGNYAGAESHFASAITAIEGLNPDEQTELPVVLAERARLRITTQNILGAITDFERAISFRESHLGPQHITVADTLDELAELHLTQSTLRDATALFTRSADIRQRTLGENHPLVALGHDNLARVHMARGDTAAAKSDLQAALLIRREAWNNRHPVIADNLQRLAEVSLAEKDTEAAIELVEEALAIRVDLFGPENEAVTETERQLAALRRQVDQVPQPSRGAPSVADNEMPIPNPVETQVSAAAGDQPYEDNPAQQSAVTAEVAAVEVVPETETTEIASDPIVDEPVAPQIAATPDIAPDDSAIRPSPTNADANGYKIQLSSLRSSDAAEQEWRRLSAAFPEILGAHDLLLTTVDLADRGTFFRVRTGSFASSDAARKACADLQQRQQDCLVIAP